MAALTLAAMLLLGSVVAAGALPTSQGIDGTLRDNVTNAPIGGIVVTALEAADGSWVSSGLSDANGFYSIWLPSGRNYKLQYRDPAARYGETWSGGWVNLTDSTSIGPVPVSTWVHANRFMSTAAAVMVVVSRANHPLTLLPGRWVVEQQKAGITQTMQQLWATTGGDGSATFSGLNRGGATYKESVIDPSGKFIPTDATNAFRVLAPGTTVVNASLFVASASMEITPTVPYAKHLQRRNVSFTASGTFSKSVVNGSQIQVLAIKGGSRKVFGGKIKSSKYSVKVRLPKGTWTLYALFKGNSAFAPNDSLTGRSVRVR